ncbi:gamma-glutamylcyclotransferase, partial [Thioclava sp. BHET1]
TSDHVARTLRPVPNLGPPQQFTPMTDDDITALRDEILSQKPQGPLMIFGYGSLIWKPDFAPVAHHHATAPGWHREFCIELNDWRGTPEAPGLMMALQSGGSCTGLLLEVAPDQTEAVTETLIRREAPYREFRDMARWITTRTARGLQKALVFWAGPKGPLIHRGLPLPRAAHMIARACGHAGSSAEYLYNPVAALDS